MIRLRKLILYLSIFFLSISIAYSIDFKDGSEFVDFSILNVSKDDNNQFFVTVKIVKNPSLETSKFEVELGTKDISRRSFMKWERINHSHGATL